MSRCILAVVSVLLALAVAATATALPDEERTVNGDAHLLEEAKGVATKGDDQSSSSGGGSSNGSGSGCGEHSKESKKQPKNCLTKVLCHKKKIICSKECTLAAHSRCAAKCSKSCVPTCS
jgi:hypothetical protein